MADIDARLLHVGVQNRHLVFQTHRFRLAHPHCIQKGKDHLIDDFMYFSRFYEVRILVLYRIGMRDHFLRKSALLGLNVDGFVFDRRF